MKNNIDITKKSNNFADLPVFLIVLSFTINISAFTISIFSFFSLPFWKAFFYAKGAKKC